MCPEESGTSARRQAEGPTSARQKPQKVAHFWTGPAASLGSRRLTHSLTARPAASATSATAEYFVHVCGRQREVGCEKLRETQRKQTQNREFPHSEKQFHAISVDGLVARGVRVLSDRSPRKRSLVVAVSSPSRVETVAMEVTQRHQCIHLI